MKPETHEYVEQVFHYLHTIPEKKFQEFKTAKFIAEELKKFGFEVEEQIAETGVIARLRSSQEGPVLGVRADMDSLPYLIDGHEVDIHSCGHDAHSSMVLATAKSIAEEGIARGTAVFIFQPAEETLEGALGMIETQKLNDLTELVGIHLRPIQDAKLGEASPAIYHTACHRIQVKIHGKPAHSARPHLGINTIEAAMHAISAVNSIKIDPHMNASVKVTKINSHGLASNVIPDRTDVIFDFRAETDEIMEDLVKRVEFAITSSIQANGATSEVECLGSSPAAQFDEEMIKTAEEAIQETLGCVLKPGNTAGSEDFHIFTKKLGTKSAYLGLGADLAPGLHHPKMKFDIKALSHGHEVLKRIVLKRLG